MKRANHLKTNASCTLRSSQLRKYKVTRSAHQGCSLDQYQRKSIATEKEKNSIATEGLLLRAREKGPSASWSWQRLDQAGSSIFSQQLSQWLWTWPQSGSRQLNSEVQAWHAWRPLRSLEPLTTEPTSHRRPQGLWAQPGQEDLPRPPPQAPAEPQGLGPTQKASADSPTPESPPSCPSQGPHLHVSLSTCWPRGLGGSGRLHEAGQGLLWLPPWRWSSPSEQALPPRQGAPGHPWSPWQPGPPPSRLSSVCTRPGDQARRDSFPQGRSLGCPGGGGTCLLGFLALWWVGSWSLPSEDWTGVL